MILQFNLQFFAASGEGGEKTEPATAKKLSDARKKGQVAKSREIANALGILTMFLIIKVWIGNIGSQLLEVFQYVYGRISTTVVFWNGTMPQNDTNTIFRYMLLNILLIIAPFLLIGALVAFVSDLFQVKWRPTTKPLKPKFSKLNPVSGVKRLFSVNSLIELIKAVAKIFLIVWVAYTYLADRQMMLLSLFDMPLMQAIALEGQILTDLGIRIAAVYMLIALADFIYQKFKFKKDMRMTKQEVKDEYKQTEGDPQIKARIMRKMREVSQRRMMQNLPSADVVITNPTHFAVAIKYDPNVADAPIVIAKGEDYLAQRIKEIARENNVEIVENKPLARTLYSSVEVGEAVPPELYQMVAEVLAFVYHLKGKI